MCNLFIFGEDAKRIIFEMTFVRDMKSCRWRTVMYFVVGVLCFDTGDCAKLVVGFVGDTKLDTTINSQYNRSSCHIPNSVVLCLSRTVSSCIMKRTVFYLI